METETITKPANSRVRVVIEGTAHPVLDSHGKATKALRVRYDGAGREASVLLLTSSPNVTVESLAPERRWTDGDVVQIVHTDCPPLVFSREGGFWQGVGASIVPHEDETLTRWAGGDHPGTWQVLVLRYQAGDL